MKAQKRSWLFGVMAGTVLTFTTQVGMALAEPPDVIHFQLVPNPAFVRCLAQYPDNPDRPSIAEVTVRRGRLNDVLQLHARHIKPGLAFDLFTVERTSLLNAQGDPNPDFVAHNRSFGLAWYQSDIEANDEGEASVRIRTILLDQIFGFDPDVQLPPTNTFHVGFWFNDPNDAAACGFNVNNPTPFNGEHMAGPLAMISVPDPDTQLGPLCSNPDTSTSPVRCNP